MAAIAITASKVRPLLSAKDNIERFVAASTNVAVGKVVYVTTSGTIELADATDTLAEAEGRGIVVSVGPPTENRTTAAVGDPCDVVMYGAVELGVSSVTDGAVAYVSTTAGALDQTAPATIGNYPFVMGWFKSDTVFFVNPQVIPPTAVT